MAGWVCTWVLIFSVLATCSCSNGIGVMHKRINRFNKKLNNFKIELAQMDTDLQDSIDIAKEFLRLDLTQLIKQQVDEAMAEFRESESVPEVGNPHVVSEIQRLKQGHHHMKRQLHSVMKTLRDVQLEKDMYRDSFIKAETSIAETCLNFGRNIKLMENVLKQCNRFDVKPNLDYDPTDTENSNLTLVVVNFSLTCKEEIEQPSSSPISSTTTTTISPPSTSTSEQQPPVMNRLIIGQYDSPELSQISLNNNSLSRYPLRVSGGLSSLCFVHRLRRLLVGTRNSRRIMSTSLDGEDTQTLREDVLATGMAVDEGRQLVFMTTTRHRIGSMTTRGENFTVIRTLAGNGYLRDIAVNTKEREIYASSNSKIFTLGYDGMFIRILVYGDMWDQSFDSVRNILYFNDGTTLKKMSMSDEVISDVTTLSVIPYTLTYYNDTVYYGGGGGSQYVGAVHLGETIVETKLQTLSFYLFVCLVP